MSDDKTSTNGESRSVLRDGFWRSPPDKHFAPPFPGAGYETPSESAVDAFCSFLMNAGLEPRALDLRFQYQNSLLPAVQDHQAVAQAATGEVERDKKALEQARRDRHEAAEAFVAAMAEAGLPLDPAVHLHDPRNHPSEQAITLTRVEGALDQDCARPDEIAGRYGIEPPDDLAPPWHTQLVRTAVNWILPVAVGIVFGINLAVLTGFVDLDRLGKGQGLVYALIGVIAGIAIEAAAGYAAAGTARILAHSREPDPFDEGSFPRHRVGVWLFLAITLLLLLIAGGIVIVDALGLHELHRQSIRGELSENIEEQLQPFWVYLMAGAVISLPYLLFKFLTSWFSSASRLRHARLSLLAQRYLSERRRDPAVRNAFVAAQRVQNLHEQENWLTKSIERWERRHDAAREAASTEAQKFRDLWNQLIQVLLETRIPQSTAAIPGDGSHPTQPQTNETPAGDKQNAGVIGLLRRMKGKGRQQKGSDGYLS
jgi:hypothetical protein